MGRREGGEVEGGDETKIVDDNKKGRQRSTSGLEQQRTHLHPRGRQAVRVPAGLLHPCPLRRQGVAYVGQQGRVEAGAELVHAGKKVQFVVLEGGGYLVCVCGGGGGIGRVQAGGCGDKSGAYVHWT